MEPQDLAHRIFVKYSVTYSSAARLFPRGIRDEVALLYAFVRLADEYVDNPIGDPATELAAFRTQFDAVWAGKNHSRGDDEAQIIIVAFIELAKKRAFKKEWIDAFFDSMAQDISPGRYSTWEELMIYVYGSAEVIGLMMNRIMGATDALDQRARALGASMQLINFLRDVEEDHQRGRLYIPLELLQSYHLQESDLFMPGYEEQKRSVVQAYIQSIDALQAEAEAGMQALSRGCRRPVKFASLAYLHTLNKIRRNPLLVFSGVPKNNWKDLACVLLKNSFSLYETSRTI